VAIQANDPEIFARVVPGVSVDMVKLNRYRLSTPFREAAYPAEMPFFSKKKPSSRPVTKSQVHIGHVPYVTLCTNTFRAILVVGILPDPFTARAKSFSSSRAGRHRTSSNQT